MAIKLPEMLTSSPEAEAQELTPQDIVAELAKYVVGQKKAKKAVAIALRNRLRRRKLPPQLADEVAPKNIIMIGPTGVGKTEIARRLSALTQSPFIKVEATRFTEVGYKGRDVESMVRDLLGIAVDLVKQKQIDHVAVEAQRIAENRMLDILLPEQPETAKPSDQSGDRDTFHQTREKLRHQLRAGDLDDRRVELELPDGRFPSFEIITSSGIEEMGIQMQDMLSDMFPGRTRRKTMRVAEAIEHITRQEQMKLIDMQEIGEKAVELVENSGIIFLDEIDKIVGNTSGHGPDVSREGVQRDILPIIEGTTVQTKYGLVRTDHILFIAAGAFHNSHPSDLIPELQGRFPIRVELASLTKEDFVKILRDPKNALITQYRALLATEGIELQFTPEAIEEIAEFATQVNQNTENIGARRLHTVMEKLLEEISFHAPDLEEKTQIIDATYVRDMLSEIATDQDLSRYIL